MASAQEKKPSFFKKVLFPVPLSSRSWRTLLFLASLLASCSESFPERSSPSGLFRVSEGGAQNPTSPTPTPPTQSTVTPPPDLFLPEILTPEPYAEGVLRDVRIIFAAPLSQPSRYTLATRAHSYRLIPTQDPGVYESEEPLPPWSFITLMGDNYPILSFTTGADLSGDPLRVMATEPLLQYPLAPEQGIELRFSHRIPVKTQFSLSVTCNGREQEKRSFLLRRGARLRIEPLYAWDAPSTCTITFQGFSLPPTGALAFQIAPISFTTLAPQGRLRLSEVVVDPQSDWNDTTPFDPVPGTGTISESDEYVEIVNASPAVVDLTGYRLEMLDGTDEVYRFGESAPSTILRILPEGATYTGLPPCGVVIVGNPPGQMNNESLIRLVAPDNTVVDFLHLTGSSALAGLPQVYYSPSGGGNASGPEDEAVYPLWVTGPGAPLVQGRATPGFAPCP